MKEHITRRQVLGRGAAAAGLTTALSLQKQLAAHGVHSIGPGGLIGAPPPSVESRQRTFRSFIDWWEQFGEASAQETARHVSYFDAEVLCLQSVSLPTKVEMQRARNLKHIKRAREREFARELSLHGIFKWWA